MLLQPDKLLADFSTVEVLYCIWWRHTHLRTAEANIGQFCLEVPHDNRSQLKPYQQLQREKTTHLVLETDRHFHRWQLNICKPICWWLYSTEIMQNDQPPFTTIFCVMDSDFYLCDLCPTTIPQTRPMTGSDGIFLLGDDHYFPRIGWIQHQLSRLDYYNVTGS